MKKKVEVKEVLTRQVAEILPSKAGLESLMAKKKIRLYLGIDPTGVRLHLGHAIGLRKLQQFADLGHEVILLVGTGTVLAGDPSQRGEARARVTEKEVQKNIATWKRQAAKVIDFKKVEIRSNGDWLKKLRLPDIINIASNISAAQLFQRDMFQERLKRGGTVWTHELLYPLLQGYDSVAMDVDLEVGGTDQVFNMLVGRDLQKKMNNREKFVLTWPMIVGVDGKQMSKTSGNTINLDDEPNDMYGKVMTLQDKLIGDYFELCTDIPLKEVGQIRKKAKKEPREYKARLAKTIVEIYHGEKKAEQAEKEFNSVFREKKKPSDIKKVKGVKKELPLGDLLVKAGLASSKSEARRLVVQGGVRINDIVQKDSQEVVNPTKGMIIQVGKRRFVQIG